MMNFLPCINLWSVRLSGFLMPNQWFIGFRIILSVYMREISRIFSRSKRLCSLDTRLSFQSSAFRCTFLSGRHWTGSISLTGEIAKCRISSPTPDPENQNPCSNNIFRRFVYTLKRVKHWPRSPCSPTQPTSNYLSFQKREQGKM